MVGPDGQETVARPGTLRARVGRIEAPLSAVLGVFGGPRMAWLAPDGTSVVGCGETVQVEADGPDRFDEVRRRAAALFDALEVSRPPSSPDAATPRLLGGFAFHDVGSTTPPWVGFPGAQFILPRVQVTRTDGDTWLTVTGTSVENDDLRRTLEGVRRRLDEQTPGRSPPPGITDVERTPDRAGWQRQVRAAVERIDAGDLEKVVLAQTLTARLRGPFRLADTLARLGEAYPDCDRFAIDPGLGATFFGATPERLVTAADGEIHTVALAGSIGRGGTEREDARLAEALETSEKVRHEHGVVVDAVRRQLATVADDVTVGDRTVRKLSNVQHLQTPIDASRRPATHVLDLVAALHPTPAVGGRPPDAARRLIQQTERFDRGWYAGPVGWFDAEGDGAFAVGIRSAVATAERATLFAGNGIVADSDPDEEWDELQLKYRPILDQLR